MATRSLAAPVLAGYIAHCAELLAPLGPVRVRRMFGGHGLYLDEVFLALVLSEQLYLKTDEQTVAAFQAAGCTPFAYEGAGRIVTTSYWTAPEEAMESPAAMQAWARLAFEAGLRARARKAPKRPAAPRKPPPAARTRPPKRSPSKQKGTRSKE